MITLSTFQLFFLVALFIIGWIIAFLFGYFYCKDEGRTTLSTAPDTAPTVILVDSERIVLPFRRKS